MVDVDVYESPPCIGSTRDLRKTNMVKTRRLTEVDEVRMAGLGHVLHGQKHFGQQVVIDGLDCE
jgi:hypothetical protein